MGDVIGRGKRTRAKKQARSRHVQHEIEQRLLAMADIVAAHSDVVTASGSALSRRLNELARDILDANQIIQRREQEITGINSQLSAMELCFAHAHAGLSRAQDLVGDIIDGGVAQIHRQRTLATMEQALQGIRVVLGDEKIDTWEKDKVDGILKKLDSIYQRNQCLYRYKFISQGVASLAQRFRDVTFDTRFSYLLAVDPDHDNTLHKFREEAHDSAKQGKKALPAAYFRHREPKTAKTSVRSAPLESPTGLPGLQQLSRDAQAFLQPLLSCSPPQPRKMATMKYREQRLTMAQRELLWKISSSPALVFPTMSPPPQPATPGESGILPCQCLTCRFNVRWPENPCPSPEALKDALIQSNGGVENFHKSVVESVGRTGVQLTSFGLSELLSNAFRCIASHADEHTQ